MAIRFNLGDNVKLNDTITRDLSLIDQILVRSGLLPLELGEWFNNHLTITSHASISSACDYTASIAIDRILPYARRQQCDIYVNDNELELTVFATAGVNGHPFIPSPGSTLNYNGSGQPIWTSPPPTKNYKFKVDDIITLDPNVDFGEICKRSGICGLDKSYIGEIKISRIGAHNLLGVPTGIDYEAILTSTASMSMFRIYLMESEIGYTVSCSDHNISFETTPKDHNCTHPRKYLNVISAGLKFYVCPDCKCEIK